MTLREHFEQLSVLHAKMSAKYRAVAETMGDKDAERTEDAPATPESIGDADTETVA